MRAVLVLIGVLFSSGVIAANCAHYNALLQGELQLSEEEKMDLLWEDEVEGTHSLVSQAYVALAGSEDLAAIEQSHQQLRDLYRQLKRGYSKTASSTYISLGVQSGCAKAPERSVAQVLAEELTLERARLEKKVVYVEQKVDVKDLPTVSLD